MAKIVDGKEVLDSTPLEVPLHWRRPPSLRDQIKQFVRTELSAQAEDRGFDSFEEADDFEMDEDPDPLSRYELTPAQEEVPVSAITKRQEKQEAPQEKKSAGPAATPVDPASSAPSGAAKAE